MNGNIPSFPLQALKETIEILQINLGTRCNQSCIHCHVHGSPEGTSMQRDTAQRIIARIEALPVRRIEFTGGAPELNPCLPGFIERLSGAGREVTVRTNLTVLALAGYEHFFGLYPRMGVKLVASLPCYQPENVDRQRGPGVYDASIAVLRRLNSLGYGTGKFTLDLVYNPVAAVLPPNQQALELGYRRALQDIGIYFTRLVALANVPVGRFRESLALCNRYADYLLLLQRNYNARTCEHLMCRSLLSIDHQGAVYDCDFNLALGLGIRGHEEKRFWDIDFSDFRPGIVFGEHCWACTAGAGSSCHGALLACDRGNGS